MFRATRSVIPFDFCILYNCSRGLHLSTFKMVKMPLMKDFYCAVNLIVRLCSLSSSIAEPLQKFLGVFE